MVESYLSHRWLFDQCNYVKKSSDISESVRKDNNLAEKVHVSDGGMVSLNANPNSHEANLAATVGNMAAGTQANMDVLVYSNPNVPNKQVIPTADIRMNVGGAVQKGHVADYVKQYVDGVSALPVSQALADKDCASKKGSAPKLVFRSVSGADAVSYGQALAGSTRLGVGSSSQDFILINIRSNSNKANLFQPKYKPPVRVGKAKVVNVTP